MRQLAALTADQIFVVPTTLQAIATWHKCMAILLHRTQTLCCLAMQRIRNSQKQLHVCCSLIHRHTYCHSYAPLQVGSATSNVLVFTSSSAATLHYLLAGRLLSSYAVVYSGTSFASSVTGLTVISELVKRTGPSIIVLVLAFIMGAGALLSGFFGVLQAWQDWEAGRDMGFRNPCKA